MHASRIAIVVVGVLLPYAVRIPRGIDWLRQYTDVEPGGHLFFGAFNAVAWGSLFVASFLFRRAAPLLVPCLLGFGFLGWAHSRLDLSSDAQAGIALVFIPLYALLPIAVGTVIGMVVDRRLARRDAA